MPQNTNMNSSMTFLQRSCLGLVAGLVAVLIPTSRTMAQVPPGVASQLQSSVGNRVESLTILGGDYGVSGGTFSSVQSSGSNKAETDLNISKFGGMGDVGDPRPLGLGNLKWQPRLQGSMGHLTAERKFTRGVLARDENEYDVFAIQFGGGARFWFTDHLSLTPTLTGMYGHTEDDFTARSAFSQANVAAARRAGLIDWEVDTWTVRPGAELAYTRKLRRTVFEITSGLAHFHTEDFDSSSSNVAVDGESQTWMNKIDVDVPLGAELFGRELHTGGYFSRTDFYGDMEDGLGTDYVYEVHGRFVLDYLGKLWKVQWIGLGASYLWGSDFDGWSFGADVRFKF